MIALVTLTDLAGYRHVADSVKNSAVWPQFVSEAQQLDVKIWLGDALLNELATQAATSPASFSAANLALLNGGSYVYNTRTYLFQGLKACIMYYAFARFTSHQPYNYTAAGITVKDTDFSTPASDKAVQRLATEAKLTADAIKSEIRTYLRRHATTYPLYRTTNAGGRPRTFYTIGD